MARRLLIISCSQKKKNVCGKKPAIEVYDGPVFRMIRKLKNNSMFPRDVDILIISGKYGVISPQTKIENYDQKITKENMKKIKNSVAKKLFGKINQKSYDEIFVNLGKDYLVAIEGINKHLSSNTKLIYAEGGIGKKLSETKRWLLESYISDY